MHHSHCVIIVFYNRAGEYKWSGGKQCIVVYSREYTLYYDMPCLPGYQATPDSSLVSETVGAFGTKVGRICCVLFSTMSRIILDNITQDLFLQQGLK